MGVFCEMPACRRARSLSIASQPTRGILPPSRSASNDPFRLVRSVSSLALRSRAWRSSSRASAALHGDVEPLGERVDARLLRVLVDQFLSIGTICSSAVRMPADRHGWRCRSASAPRRLASDAGRVRTRWRGRFAPGRAQNSYRCVGMREAIISVVAASQATHPSFVARSRARSPSESLEPSG